MNRWAGAGEIVVTGIGATTPLGGDAPGTWAGVAAGASGVSMLDTDWADQVPARVAAFVAKDPASSLTRIEARSWDRCQQLGIVAAREAWNDAGSPDLDPDRLAVVVASGVGGIGTTIGQYRIFLEKGARSVSPYSIPTMMPNGTAAAIGLELGAGAGVHAPTSACASGSEAIAQGAELLRSGRADIVVCGGTEAPILPITLAGFAAMRALSARGEPAETASRPFDRDRDGFVIGEGAGVLVLERRRDAVARGHRPHAVLMGSGVTSDAHHVTRPEPQGRGAARAIIAALSDAGVGPGDVVHVNAHATSTPLGDIAEARALATVFGRRVGDVAVSATKSGTGHLLGAAGAVEAILTAAAVRDGIAPPTLNLETQDPQVGLSVVTERGHRMPAGIALSNSFGFGGHNVVLAFAAA